MEVGESNYVDDSEMNDNGLISEEFTTPDVSEYESDDPLRDPC